MAVPKRFSGSRSLGTYTSMTVTAAPMPTALAAGCSPATPPPITATCARGAGDATEQDALAPVGAHEMVGTDLGRQATREFTHGLQQRESTAG